MHFKDEAMMLSAISKPYNFDGNVGVSHRIRLNINGEIYVCKSNAEQITEMKKNVGKKGQADILITSPKENLSMELVGFSTDDE